MKVIKTALLLIFTFCIVCVSAQVQKRNVSEKHSVENAYQSRQNDTLKKQIEDLRQQQTLLKQQYDALQHIAEFNIERYHENTTCVIGLFGVFITIVIALISILMPIMVNKNYEKQFKTIIKDVNDKIKEYNGRISNLETMQNEVQQMKETIETSKQDLQEIIKEIQAIQYFNEALKSTDLNKQIERYDKAIELNQKFAEAYNNRANTKSELGQNEQAIEDYNKAIELNPEYAEAYYNRATTKSELGQKEEAIEDYNKAIELNPEYAKAYNNRANTKFKLGQNESAI